MPIGVIPAIIAAGGAVGAAGIQAHAAGSARKSQEAAGAKANARLDPYATAGYGAVSNLQGMIGRPAPAASAAPMAETASPAPAGGTIGMANRWGITPPGSTLQSLAGGGGQMVTVRAPTGETQQVPATQSGYWQSKGATVVG